MLRLISSAAAMPFISPLIMMSINANRLMLHCHVDGVFSIIGRGYNVVAQLPRQRSMSLRTMLVFGYENIDWHVKES